MRFELPSLHKFRPRYFQGGPGAAHLALQYDLAALVRPARVVFSGFGDGQAFFTWCQAATEQGYESECLVFPREPEGADDDEAWRLGREHGFELYGAMARFAVEASAGAAGAPDGIDVLVIEDCDAGAEVAAQLRAFAPKLSPGALVLVQGIGLERETPAPRDAWEEWSGDRWHTALADGTGLGLTVTAGDSPAAGLVEKLFGTPGRLKETAGLYRLITARLTAEAEAEAVQRRMAALEARQLWLDSILEDRWKAQQVMDHQAAALARLQERFADLEQDRGKAQDVIEEQQRQFEALRRDRAKAQQVMDHQRDQISAMLAEAAHQQAGIDSLRQQLKQQKKMISAARKACGRKGRCFEPERVALPAWQKIPRELRRLGRKLGLVPAGPAATPPVPVAAVPARLDLSPERYERWIQEHEPSAAMLARQKETRFSERPRLSVVIPVHNPPREFLRELLRSLDLQTYPDWEVCLVDAGSDPATSDLLREWEAARGSLARLVRLDRNLGIAENTNRGLAIATGDYVTFADHDDLLAPFAFYEIAQAIKAHPGADILYSDEDRLRSGRAAAGAVFQAGVEPVAPALEHVSRPPDRLSCRVSPGDRLAPAGV